MKRLITDACTKTAFCFNNKVYRQIDRVPMRSLLGPILAYIIMTELESTTARKLFDQSLVKLYMRYADNTLHLDKEKDIDLVQKPLNFFHKNITYTVHTFEDEKVHFLCIEIVNNKTNVYHKPTNADQYMNFHSQKNLKTLWPLSIDGVQLPQG